MSLLSNCVFQLRNQTSCPRHMHYLGLLISHFLVTVSAPILVFEINLNLLGHATCSQNVHDPHPPVDHLHCREHLATNLVMSTVLCLWQLPLFGMQEEFSRRHLRPASLPFQLLFAIQLEPYHDPLVKCG